MSRDVFKSFSLPGQELGAPGSGPAVPAGTGPASGVVSPPLSAPPGTVASNSGGGANSGAAKVARAVVDPTPDPTMLRKLIDDLENAVAVCEDIEVDAPEEPLHGQIACQTDDVVSHHWNS